MYLSKQSFCTRGGAEVAALGRCVALSALPALGILADGAVSQAMIVVAWASSAGEGGLVALDSGAAHAFFGLFAFGILTPFLHRGSTLNATILTTAAVIPSD